MATYQPCRKDQKSFFEALHQGGQTTHNFRKFKKFFEGPVLNCRGSTTTAAIIQMKLSLMKFGTMELQFSTILIPSVVK
jgi:hypothetical protein